MGEGKINALLKTASVNSERAKNAKKRNEWDDCILHASLAIESCANALIIELGGHEAMNHRAISALNEVTRRKNPEWLGEEDFQEMIRRGLALQREVVYSRYPHHVEGKWISADEYYGEEEAEKASSDAEFVIKILRKYLGS